MSQAEGGGGAYHWITGAVSKRHLLQNIPCVCTSICSRIILFP